MRPCTLRRSTSPCPSGWAVFSGPRDWLFLSAIFAPFPVLLPPNHSDVFPLRGRSAPSALLPENGMCFFSSFSTPTFYAGPLLDSFSCAPSSSFSKISFSQSGQVESFARFWFGGWGSWGVSFWGLGTWRWGWVEGWGCGWVGFVGGFFFLGGGVGGFVVGFGGSCFGVWGFSFTRPFFTIPPFWSFRFSPLCLFLGFLMNALSQREADEGTPFFLLVRDPPLYVPVSFPSNYFGRV